MNIESQPHSPAQPSIKVQYNDRAAFQMIVPAVIFMVVGMSVGVFMSFNVFVFPDALSGEYIQFGRIRPMHVTAVTLLWLLSANMGLFYYFVPRLCGTSLWSPKLATWTSFVWWIPLILGVFSFPWGTNFGWEYAELPTWLMGVIPIKGLFAGAWILFMINIFMTIANRRYKQMYVSLWYVMGTLIWTGFAVIVGNFAMGLVPGGISRVNMNFFYVHNLVGLIFTPQGLAIAYYFIPKSANAPIYSHRLSMVGFWSIAFVYAWIGAHHIIHGPMSQWLQTTSIVFSIWLFVPVWTVVANFFLTLKGHWQAYTQSPAVRFLMMGTLFYLMTCIQGPLMALRNVNEVTSKTDWVIGHAHIALYGTFTFFSIAGIYYAIPFMTKKRLWSESFAEWHFNLNLLGSLLMFSSLFIGGFLQGLQWADWATGSSYADFHRNISEVSFIKTIEGMHTWWVIRGLGGMVILAGNLLFVVNILNTILLKSQDLSGGATDIKAGV